MPYWNRPRELTRSLALYEKMYPDLDLEFSICDDGSMPPLDDRPRCKITRLRQKMIALNPCVPINVAVRNASHDVIVLTNPEIEHREPVLQQMLAALQDENDYVMAACRDPRLGIISGEGTPYNTQGRGPIPYGSDLHFCVMFHRKLFNCIGGFDEEYRNGAGWDDNDWLWRLNAYEANFKRVPGTVWHYRTPHRWTMKVDNAALFRKKWGNVEGIHRCA